MGEYSLEEFHERLERTWRFDAQSLCPRSQSLGLQLWLRRGDLRQSLRDGDWNIAHAPAAWELMFQEVPSPALGLEWEPCHQMVSLIDPLPQLRQCRVGPGDALRLRLVAGIDHATGPGVVEVGEFGHDVLF